MSHPGQHASKGPTLSPEAGDMQVPREEGHLGLWTPKGHVSVSMSSSSCRREPKWAQIGVIDGTRRHIGMHVVIVA